jgi:hypothetical protein
MMGAAHHVLSRFRLCLGEAENCYTIRIREIVGNADRLDDVGLVADVVAQHPFPGRCRLPWTAFGFAISQCKPSSITR